MDSIAVALIVLTAIVLPSIITVAGTIISNNAARVAAQTAAEMRTILTTVVANNNNKLDTIKRTSDEIRQVSKETHALVNSNYGTSLMATLMALRNVARLTADPDARLLAEAAVAEAERQYAEYLRKQAAADAVA